MYFPLSPCEISEALANFDPKGMICINVVCDHKVVLFENILELGSFDLLMLSKKVCDKTKLTNI
jgi:hypothetical protein